MEVVFIVESGVHGFSPRHTIFRRTDKTRQCRIRPFLPQRKKAILMDGLLFNLVPGSLWRASCPPPSGPLLRNVQIRSRRICPALESVHRQTTDKTKGPVFRPGLLFYLMPGSSLLSHGETPHYHRRYGVSLLSSAWGQVGPPRYLRQANSVLSTRLIPTCRFNLLSSLLIDVSSAKTSSAL